MISSSKNLPTEAEAFPSWKEDGILHQIIDYIQTVTDPESPDYIPVCDRIVTMDIDGTLIPEHGSKIDNDRMTLLSVSEVLQYMGTVAEQYFDPEKGFRYGHMLYRPMKELYDYLIAHEFTVFFVSGNCNALTYAWAQHYFGAEYAHCIGSNIELKIVEEGGFRVLPTGRYEGSWCEVKCYRIYNQIGQCPVLAVGNSDGDVQMLRWVLANPKYRSLSLMVNHDDSREYVYNTEEVENYCKTYGITRLDMSANFRMIL